MPQSNSLVIIHHLRITGKTPRQQPPPSIKGEVVRGKVGVGTRKWG